MSATAEHWASDLTETMHFASILVKADWIADTAEAVLYYLEKPYKYDREHAIWVECGQPGEDGPEWDAFEQRLEADED